MKIIFEINSEEYTIPEMTVYDWYHIQDELVLNPEAGLSVISYLSGCNIDLLRQMEAQDFMELWDVTQNFITDQSKSNKLPDQYYKFQRTKYSLINPDKMTIGQFADLDIIINSPGQEKRIHEIMAYLYYPVTKETPEDFDLEKVKARSEEFKMVPLKDAVKALNFFLLSGQLYLNNILDYLTSIDLEMETPEVKEIIQMTLRRLQEVGTQPLLFCQEETLPKWTSYPNSKYAQHLTGSPSLKTKPKRQNSRHKKSIPNITNN
jgi:hypothetical protein